MRKQWWRFMGLPALLLTSSLAFSQGYERTFEFKNTILKGIVEKAVLESDTAFSWFLKNKAGYVPEEMVVKAFEQKKDSVHFLVFMGTWCADTRRLLPRFYGIADSAGIPDRSISLVGVDFQKKTLGNLTEIFHVTHVPTFIVLKQGKEIGRVVEYGVTGRFDRELAEIIQR